MSEQTVHEFTIARIIRGEHTEFELKASFDIFPAVPQKIRQRRGSRLPNIDPAEGGCAQLVGEIFLANEGVPWDGRLTRKEKEQLEDEVYETWMESNEPITRTQRLADDSCVVDESFDDFDDDMALKTANLGQVFW